MPKSKSASAANASPPRSSSNGYEIKYDAILDTLDLALNLTDNIQAAYLQADTTERRLLNQAGFESAPFSSIKVLSRRAVRSAAG